MKIVEKIDLPDTVNAWGFGGAIKKRKFVMENGDVWVSGLACYRHAPSEKYIQLSRNPEFTGGLTAIKDVLLRKSPEKFIEEYYSKNK